MPWPWRIPDKHAKAWYSKLKMLPAPWWVTRQRAGLWRDEQDTGMGRRRKKIFPCGHEGYGQHCHRCAQQHRDQHSRQAEQAEQRARKAEWKASFAHDPIDLRLIQHRRDLVQKARQIIAAVAAGEHPGAFGGKPLNYDQQVISVPLDYSYRLIFHETTEQIIPHLLESHETYNRRTRKK